jgi:hypothetical protein
VARELKVDGADVVERRNTKDPRVVFDGYECHPRVLTAISKEY